MEKEDAAALRFAMEDMALTKEQLEDAQLHAAAQKEASELVYQHQYPEAISRADAPYRYKEHLRKNSYQHARTQSANSRYSGTVLPQGFRAGSRSVSGGTLSSEDSGRKGRTVSGSSIPEDRVTAGNVQVEIQKSRKSYGGLDTAASGTRRRTSGKRNISGEPAGTFSADQIYEEPETESRLDTPPDRADMPAPLRLRAKNPISRVQFAEDARCKSTPPETTAKLSKYEIHRNPPSQSRNPAYTANPLPQSVEIRPDTPTKDGIEIRSDDIRQATSKSLKDRSAKLPTPVVVSDKPGRPIVSFDANWKPRVEADRKPAEEHWRPRIEHRYGAGSESKSLPGLPAQEDFQQANLPVSQLPGPPVIQVNDVPEVVVPSINNTPDAVPTISFPDAPSISVSAPPAAIPTINFPDAPSISVSAPSIEISAPDTEVSAPTISVSAPTTRPSTARPLPDPKVASTRPLPRHIASAPVTSPQRHWSPGPFSRATATCHQCQLPISGRVVSVRGLTERFHPECLICFTCGTALEALEISPEPDTARTARLDRITRRQAGETIPDIEGQTEAEDGDPRLRFYCHLDWHELYAPRCKHCRTPILGEHAVALGAHWHYGHFFCAECGDPFERGMTHIEVDGYAWCLSCQTKRTERRAPKCKGCRKGVVGNYVEALGGEWHDECFRCVDCNGPFDDGRILAREEYGVQVAACLRCMQIKWKA